MKKLLFILPFCAAALAEEKTVTVVYKPIAETNVSTLPGSVTDETSARTGTWTNESTGKDGVVSYHPTARNSKEQLYPLPNGVGNHSYYDTAGEKLVNGESQEFRPVTMGSVDFAGTIKGNADGSCTLTFGTGDYSITKELINGFTLNSVIICMDGGYSDSLKTTVYATEISKLRISYTKPLPEPATATLSLPALAGLASRRRRH